MTNKPNESVLRARAAAERIGDAEELDAEALQAVVAGVIGEGSRSSHPVANILAQWTEQFPVARDAVAQLAADPRPHIRKRALRCLSPRTPRDFSLALIEAGLADPDPLVRHAAQKAASYALSLFGAYGLALCLWGQDQAAIQALSSLVQHGPPTNSYAPALAYVQAIAAGSKPRPTCLADCLRQLES